MLRGADIPDDVAVSVLIPNEKGLDNALELRDHFDEVNLFLSASETHNRKNVNRSIEESLTGLERVIERAREEGLRCEGVISVAFGCPYEGEVPRERVFGIAERLRAAGCEEIAFGDTTGMANPAQVREMFAAALRAPDGRRADRPLPQHPRAGAGERARRAGRRRALVRVVVRRAGRLPGAPGRDRQRGERGPRVDAPRDGPRHRHRPAGAGGLRPRARRRCSAARSGSHVLTAGPVDWHR